MKTDTSSAGTAKISVQPAPKSESFLPPSISVIGTTQTNDHFGCEIVLRIGVGERQRIHRFPVATLGSGDLKPLAMALAEAGLYDFAERPLLVRIARKVLRQSMRSKAIAITSAGLVRISIGETVFNGYVFRGKVYWFGPRPPVKVVALDTHLDIRNSGSFEDWVKHLGSLLVGNPYLIVGGAHSLAAAIRRAFEQEQILIGLVGPSTTGKSTSEKFWQSMLGAPSDVKTMSGTRIGILDYIASRPDLPVLFQDTRQLDSTNDFIRLIFDIAEGADRLRYGEKPRKMAATVITSNECNIVDMARGKNVGFDEGLCARILEINLSRPNGAFHNLHGEDSPAAFAKRIETYMGELYGTAWPVWLAKLQENWPSVIKYRKFMPSVKQAILKHTTTLEISAIQNRLLDALAFSAWAGCLASHFGVLPIKKSDIYRAFGLVLSEQFARQAKGFTPVGEQLLKDVRGHIDENSSHFPPLTDFSEERQQKIAGYHVKIKNHALYLFLPSVFEKLFVQGKYGQTAYSILAQSKHLVTTVGRGHQYQVRIPGTKKQKSFVAIRASIRFDEKTD